jgi:hypothetical protein
MLFDTRTVLAGVALVSQAFAAPLLEERASIGIVTRLQTLVCMAFTNLN